MTRMAYKSKEIVGLLRSARRSALVAQDVIHIYILYGQVPTVTLPDPCLNLSGMKFKCRSLAVPCIGGRGHARLHAFLIKWCGVPPSSIK
jgi:hypothetical protein